MKLTWSCWRRRKAVSLEVENLSQIHFTPPRLTEFAFHAPYCYGKNVTEEMMTMVEAAILPSPTDAYSAATSAWLRSTAIVDRA